MIIEKCFDYSNEQLIETSINILINQLYEKWFNRVEKSIIKNWLTDVLINRKLIKYSYD